MTSTEVLTPHWIISMKFTGSHKTLVNRFWGNTAKYIVCPKEITTAKQHSSILMRSALLTKPCKVSCADLFFHMYIYIYILQNEKTGSGSSVTGSHKPIYQGFVHPCMPSA